MLRTTVSTLTLFSLLALSGCAMHWEAPWQGAGPNQPTDASRTLLQAAEACYAAAGDGPTVDRCLERYDEVLRSNPGDYTALVKAANLYILKGTAYTADSSAKTDAFRRAMQYAELAMYTNPQFKARVDAGAAPWEAADTLGPGEVEAIFFWVTAVQYEFKEGMSLPAKIVNLDWLQHALVFLDRVEAVAPEFGGGAVEFAKVICYVALPESYGGSKAKGDEYMRRAVLRGTDWLLPRWALGKYYLPIKGDKQGAEQELAWVAAQDQSAYRDPYPWRVHFQDDARRLLKDQ